MTAWMRPIFLFTGFGLFVVSGGPGRDATDLAQSAPSSEEAWSFLLHDGRNLANDFIENERIVNLN